MFSIGELKIWDIREDCFRDKEHFSSWNAYVNVKLFYEIVHDLNNHNNLSLCLNSN